MNNILSTSSFVFDKSNSRFSILNIYDDDPFIVLTDIYEPTNLISPSEKIRKKFKETIIKKEEEKLKTNKCYCNIM